MRFNVRLFNNEDGFTLIELLVVIAIIVVLATMAMTSYRTANSRARDARRVADMEQLRSALEMYRTDNNEYPLRKNESWDWEVSNDGNWMEALSSNYLAVKSVDPRNDATMFYRYALCSGAVTATGMPNYKIQVYLENGGGQVCGHCDAHQGGGNWHCITNP